MVQHTSDALVKSVCVEILWEFYYHFDTHKNPSAVLLLIRFAAKQVVCDVGALLMARRWGENLSDTQQHGCGSE